MYSFFLFFKMVPSLYSKMPDGMMAFSLGGASIFELSWVIARGRYGHGKHFFTYDKDRFTILLAWKISSFKQFHFFELIKSARTSSIAVALKIFSMKSVLSAKKIVAAYSKVKFISQLAWIIYCAHVENRRIFSNDKKSIKSMVS